MKDRYHPSPHRIFNLVVRMTKSSGEDDQKNLETIISMSKERKITRGPFLDEETLRGLPDNLMF